MHERRWSFHTNAAWLVVTGTENIARVGVLRGGGHGEAALCAEVVDAEMTKGRTEGMTEETAEVTSSAMTERPKPANGNPGQRRLRMPPRPSVRGSLSQIAGLLGALLLVGIVWWLGALLIHDANVLPSPGSVASRFGDLLTADSPNALPRNAWASLLRILLGWGGGVIAGIIVGVAMASNRWIRSVLDPLIELGRPIPPLAFAPLLVIWFGIGELPKVLVLAFVTFPVVTISTVAAIQGIDPNWTRAAETLGASRLYVLRRVTVPAALPGILVSIRLANGLSWGTLVAAEIIASTSGLGWLILNSGRFLETKTVFVGIIAIGFLAFITDRILRGVEAMLVPWRGKASN